MPLPSSGPISLNQVNVELGLAGTTAISMNQANVRTLFGRASGTISMSDGYGKSNAFAFTISANQTNANLRTLAVNAGWNQSSKVVATINGGIVISSNSTGTPALTVNGSFPGGVELINNGTIAGMGGNGGAGANGIDCNCGPYYNSGAAGASGGTALTASVAVTITNGSGTIAGGGGGGGGAGGGSGGNGGSFGGGGGGGGRTGSTNSAGGSGGNFVPNGSRGGNGNAGTFSAAGSGGNTTNGSPGGAGGGQGSSGAAGATNQSGGGGGGAGGNAVTGNSNITWVSFGTRLGGIS